ncbi:hypothetical protein RUND412_010498, partial [Rhizina undulata]
AAAANLPRPNTQPWVSGVVPVVVVVSAGAATGSARNPTAENTPRKENVRFVRNRTLS